MWSHTYRCHGEGGDRTHGLFPFRARSRHQNPPAKGLLPPRQVDLLFCHLCYLPLLYQITDFARSIWIKWRESVCIHVHVHAHTHRSKCHHVSLGVTGDVEFRPWRDMRMTPAAMLPLPALGGPIPLCSGYPSMYPNIPKNAQSCLPNPLQHPPELLTL